jgi:hypothetical protein
MRKISLPYNLIFHFIMLFFKEPLETVLIKNNRPLFLFFAHIAKLQKLPESATLIYNLSITKSYTV